MMKPIINLKGYRRNDTFLYMILSRAQDDCNYYLGLGNRNKECLWAKEEKAHINEMKAIYDYLEVKPEWITMKQIIEFEKQMVITNL